MKRKKQRKQKVREMSKTQLRVQLFALTKGVSWCFTKTPDHTCKKRSKQLCKPEPSLRNLQMSEMPQFLSGSDFFHCLDISFLDILYIDLPTEKKSAKSQCFSFMHFSPLTRQKKKFSLKLQGTHFTSDLVIRQSYRDITLINIHIKTVQSYIRMLQLQIQKKKKNSIFRWYVSCIFPEA